MKTGLESLDIGAPNITYSGNEGPKSPQQMAMADSILQYEYDKYVFELKEIRPEATPMTIEEFEAQARAGMNEGGIVMQGGVKNYLGEQETVSGIPVKWQSGPDKPDTELAYITKAEKDLLLKEDIHGSLKDGPNMGPGGIMSLDSFGDIGGAGAAGVDTKASGEAKGGDTYHGPTQSGAGGIHKPLTPADIKAEEERLETIIRNQEKDMPEKTSTSVLDYIPYISAVRNFARFTGQPLDMDTFFIKNVVGGKNKYGYTEDDLEEYKEKRMAGLIDAYGNPIINTGGEGQARDLALGQNPYSINTGVTQDVTPEDLGTEFTSEFTRNELTDADKERISGIGGKSIFLADGGRIGYAGGGIADLRQGYFLGKIVKKIGRGVKKIIKSPVGKAALMAAPFLFPQVRAMIPGGGKNPGFFGKIFNKMLRTKGKDGLYNTGFDPFKIGILGASALTGLMAKQDEDDEPSLDEYMSSARRGPGMDPRAIREYIAMNKGNINPIDYAFLNPAYYQTAADGGRIGYDMGGIAGARAAALNQLYGINDDEEDKKLAFGGSAGLPPITAGIEGQNLQSFSDDETPMPTQPDQMPRPKPMMARQMNPMMGRGMNPMMGRQNTMMSMQPRMMAQEGGLMDMGGMEKDYRNEGGFVPIGGQERADDVPARLSKNEFVFTADAVRNAGGGDIDKGAEIMENMMENLEAGGKVSKGSQGLSGAREMFATQQRLGEVL